LTWIKAIEEQEIRRFGFARRADPVKEEFPAKFPRSILR
jgi:hypothetical protein